MFEWFRRQKAEQIMNLKNKTENSEQNSVEKDEKYSDLDLNPEERKRRLTKRLIEMSDKLDELSTQIYHLQQRVELLEKKTGINRWD